MPNFVDYSTENMNGTPVHTFVDANSQASPPMYGDQANSLAQNIDQFKQFQAANAGPDLRVAGPGGGVPADSVMTGSGAINSSDPGPAGPNQSVGPAVSSPPQQAAGPAPTYSQADAQAEGDKAQAAQVHQAAASGNLIAGQNDPGAFINAPTQGVSRKQLQARAAQAVATPKSGEETVEGATPYDENAAEARADASLQMRQAKQQQADMLQARAERDAAMFDQQAAIAATKLQHEQQKQQLVEDGVQQDMQVARDYRDQVAKQQVDPSRLFSGDRGAFNTIAAVIGQGLGAFAAAGGGSPTVMGRRAAAGGQNFAKDIIDGASNRDISAQEFNIRSNQASANNQLNDVYKRLGDMNQAKAVVRQMQTDYAGLQMKRLAARDGSQDAQNAFDQWDAANAADRAEQERKFTADSYGKHTVKVAQTYVTPGGGGPPSLDLQLKRAHALAELGTLGNQGASQQADLDLKHSEADKNRAEASKSSKGTDGGYNAQVETVDTALDTARQLAREYGYTIDPKTNKLNPVGLTEGFTRDVAPGMDTDATTKFKGQLANLNAQHYIATTGNKRASPEAAEQLGITLKHGGNGSTEEQFNTVYQNLLNKKRELGAGTLPNVRAQRAQQQSQVGVESQAPGKPEYEED